MLLWIAGHSLHLPRVGNTIAITITITETIAIITIIETIAIIIGASYHELLVVLPQY
jgi:hypothetical protein